MSYDFQMELKLLAESPQLHKIFSDNVLCMQNMLIKYQSVFPTFTDHTALHSLEVIAFCNELVGDNIDLLNTDEIFILLMSAYLHDAGMGISQKDFLQFLGELPQAQGFAQQNPEAAQAEIIRRFHNEFSGRYIRKYASLFDFPSEEHLFAVIQVSRGHRKTDLYDDVEYPHELRLPNGNVVHMPYLVTLIRLADELDIAADRNLQFLYDTTELTDQKDIIEFKKHKAIRQVLFQQDAMMIQADYSDPEIRDELDELFRKLDQTLSYCVTVAEKRTPFAIHQKKILVEKL